jgi:hypothetical protein
MITVNCIDVFLTVSKSVFARPSRGRIDRVATRKATLKITCAYSMSSLLGPNVLRSLFSNILKLCFPFDARGHFSRQYKRTQCEHINKKYFCRYCSSGL